MMDEALEPNTEQEQLDAILKETSDELDLAASLREEKERRATELNGLYEEKAADLEQQFKGSAEVINALANANMAREQEAMQNFSGMVQEFNGLAADYRIAMLRLRKLAGEEE